MHIPTFEMPSIREVWQLIQEGNYYFSIDLKDTYLHISILKYHLAFLWFVSQHKPYQWKVLPFGLAMAHRVFTSLKPCCSFAIARVCMLLITWIMLWSLLTPSMLARSLNLLVVSYWLILDNINFSKC